MRFLVWSALTGQWWVSHILIWMLVFNIYLYRYLPLDTLGVSDPFKRPKIAPFSTPVASPDPWQCLGVRGEILLPPVSGTGECLIQLWGCRNAPTVLAWECYPVLAEHISPWKVMCRWIQLCLLSSSARTMRTALHFLQFRAGMSTARV